LVARIAEETGGIVVARAGVTASPSFREAKMTEQEIKESIRQNLAEQAIKDVLNKLDVILGEINSINDQLREGKSCSNRKV
jgi:hypothetical protein